MIYPFHSLLIVAYVHYGSYVDVQNLSCSLLVLTFNNFHPQNLRHLAKSWLPARSVVMECLLARKDVDPSGEIMVLDRFCPVSKPESLFPFSVLGCY